MHLFFLNFTQCVTILQTVSNQEVILKRLISMLRIAQKLYVGRKVVYVRCINCSYNNVAKGIRLFDKKTVFVYIGFYLFIQEKKSCKLELLKDIPP